MDPERNVQGTWRRINFTLRFLLFLVDILAHGSSIFLNAVKGLLNARVRIRIGYHICFKSDVVQSLFFCMFMNVR